MYEQKQQIERNRGKINGELNSLQDGETIHWHLIHILKKNTKTMKLWELIYGTDSICLNSLAARLLQSDWTFQSTAAPKGKEKKKKSPLDSCF